MTKNKWNWLIFLTFTMVMISCAAQREAVVGAVPSAPAGLSKLPANLVITQADCSAEKLGTTIPVGLIGEPVSAVTLNPPVWKEGANGAQASCSVEGSIAPADKSPNACPIKFRVAMPSTWEYRAVQMGGAGMNGTIPNLSGGFPGMGSADWLAGTATYGSDSGHSTGSEWALNEEAIRNLGYMQMKKTHDAAMVIMERMYGKRPAFNYYVGGSQGGREALTVAQRYPSDYDGISAGVPIVNFSTLMLAPALIRIQEKSLANWVPAKKGTAVAGEFMRQCDDLDGLKDGIINNYAACREIFNVNDGKGTANPWDAKRCPNNIDPNPNDDSINACLMDGQIETLKFIFSSYKFKTPLANGVKSFGMWAPTTEFGMGGGSGGDLFVNKRYKGQEGAAEDAPVHTSLGGLGVTGFLFQDLSANPLDYVEGGKLSARRSQLSGWLDSTNPDLSGFYKRGGKLIIVIGTNDSIASTGAQLDYYQSLIDTMGETKIDKFARLYVIPQGGHGLTGSSFVVDASGKKTAGKAIPNSFDRFGMLKKWVENNAAPGKSEAVTGTDTSLPLCSYPAYPKYVSGDASKASAYTCASPW